MADYGMSDYQKLIFVNNIDESSDIIQGGRYNFAVYFAKSTDMSNIDLNTWDPNKPFINIWHCGQRLNRFVGIDNNQNTITIDDRSYKLAFNYNTGLLSIISTNALQSMSIEKIFWNPFYQGDISEILGQDSTEYIIDAEDNIFNIRIKYVASSGFDISNIIDTLKTITFVCKSGNQNLRFIKAELNNIIDNNIAYIDYQYQILCETNHPSNLGVDNNNVKYTINGSHSLKIENCVFRFNLNPTSLSIVDSNYNIVTNTVNISNANGVYNIPYYVNLTPNGIDNIWMNPTFNQNHPIYLVVRTSNLSDIQIAEAATGRDTAYIQLSNNSQNIFHLTTRNISVNENVSARITVSLEYNDEDFNNNNVAKCKKYFDINISGVQNQCLYYYGYTQPANNASFISKLMSYSDAGNYALLYDYATGAGASLEERNEIFYVAIPKFDKMNVRLVYDVYDKNGAYNDIEEYNTVANTIIGGHVFTINEISINGLDYIIYTSKSAGKFIGKIQVKR